MPGGICALSVDPDFIYAARCSSLIIRAFGHSREVAMGGFAHAVFPQYDTQEIQTLSRSDSVIVRWEEAVFRGRDTVLGDVIAKLNKSKLLALPESNIVSNGDLLSSGFFPAENVNYLPFQIALPRFGVKMVSDVPVVNRAIINEVPPYGSIYKLSSSVKFSNEGGLFPLRVSLEQCSVRLVELRNIKLDIEKTNSGDGYASYSATISNETTEDSIQVAWVIWPQKEDDADVGGVIDLHRAPKLIEFELPLSMLDEIRWVAVAICRPFETEAAASVRIPV